MIFIYWKTAQEVPNLKSRLLLLVIVNKKYFMFYLLVKLKYR